jgi:ribose transport system permease protein
MTNTSVTEKTATAKALHRTQLFHARETGVLLALFVMCVFLSFASDAFLTSTNLLNIGRQVSLIGIMAIGMTFVLTCGEVDLSVGSNYAFSSLATGMLIISGWSLLAARSSDR